jgi:transposase
MKAKKDDARSWTPETQELVRKKAVQAVLGGMKRKEAAKHFGVTPYTVGQWVKKAKEKGLRSLNAKPQGCPKGSCKKLANWQCATIVKLITSRYPDQLQLPFMLWTREAVRDLIKDRFGVTYSIRHVGRLLEKWGFSVQKPIRKAMEQSPPAVKKWMEEDYPLLQAKAKAEKGEILWSDEMGVRSDAASAKTYAPKGHTPVLPHTGRRFGCNMISAISNRGRLHFMVFKGHTNASRFQTFLERLIKQIAHKIFLVVDNHPIHKSKPINMFVTKNVDKIELAFLPPYSPELNPDEMLNQDVKTNAVRRQRASSQHELIANVRSYLYGRQRQPQIVKNYFNKDSVKYAA